MQKIIKLCCLLLIFSCSRLTNLKRSPSSQHISPPIMTFSYQGLEEIDLNKLDNWSGGFHNSLNKNNYEKLTFNQAKKIQVDIVRLFVSSNTILEFYSNVLNLNINKTYKGHKSFLLLARSLLESRRILRKFLNSKHDPRKAMILLELLAEEVLYIDRLKNPNTKDLVVFPNLRSNNMTKICNKKVYLNGMPLCQGDIVLSKGGAGSSNFLAKISNYPGNFSHAALTYIDSFKGKDKLFFVESFIEDGVKLRNPYNDYIKNPKVKLSIYRAKSNLNVKSSSKCVDNFYSKMQSNIKAKNLKDMMIKKSFGYDFDMNADDNSKLFCSEVIYYAYKLNCGIDMDKNPYYKKLWTNIEQEGVRIKILKNFLNTKTSFPAPSDLELNVNYKIVGTQFNLAKISKDRLRIAMVDILMSSLEEYSYQLNDVFKMLKFVGNNTVSPKELKKIMTAIGITLNDKTKYIINNIPKGINYKQFIFFAYLDKQLTPLLENLYNKKYDNKYVSLIELRKFVAPIILSQLKELKLKIEKLALLL